MVTCHSLRLLDEQLVGDPLDHKMFNFTGWSFEEGGQKSALSDDEEHNKLSPAVARPPIGMEYEIDAISEAAIVCVLPLVPGGR